MERFLKLTFHQHLDNLSFRARKLLHDKKNEKNLAELLEHISSIKNEFQVGDIGSFSWTDARRAEASAAWKEKRDAIPFWIRDGKGEITEMHGIDNVAEFLRVKVKTLQCYISQGRGMAHVRGYLVSRIKIEKMETPQDLAESWAKEYFAKNGCWPNPTDNPYIDRLNFGKKKI